MQTDTEGGLQLDIDANGQQWRDINEQKWPVRDKCKRAELVGQRQAETGRDGEEERGGNRQKWLGMQTGIVQI